MKRMKLTEMVGVVFMVGLVILGVGMAIDVNEALERQDKNIDNLFQAYNNIAIGLQTVKMYNKTPAEAFVGGLYFHNDYYSVWVKNKTEEDINRTELHELSHHLVFNDPQHFCGRYMCKNERK